MADIAVNMITIVIDNKPHQVAEQQNLLQACLSLGMDLPYFCWHPAMHSVGACRQCAVKLFKDEHDTRGRIIMSCMTPVSDGMRISVADPEAAALRGGVIEWLMLNHPHDCPVCDEGGECHLQDMTVMTGHAYRRNRFPKRTHRNQDLGPFINHEMNRCIQCYRCVRFYRGTAGGRDLDVFSSHDSIYFGRSEDGALESPFSGNLVEICPTGVFTDKTLKQHYTRKWDLQTAPSVCVHCGVGCNTIAGERYGTLRRILNRYNPEVNGYFLCDRGRFGYEFVNSEKRIRACLQRNQGTRIDEASGPDRDGRSTPDREMAGPGSPVPPVEAPSRGFDPIDRETALRRIAAMLSGSRGIIGIGSPRASLESNFLLRALVGRESFYSGMGPREQRLASLVIDILRKGPARTPSLREVRSADAVLVLGEDISNTAPLLSLAVRQASRNRQFEIAARMKVPRWDDNAVRNASQDAMSPVFVASFRATALDDVAARTYRAAPDTVASLGLAIAHELDPQAPEAAGLPQGVPALAREIAAALRQAQRPLIVSGTGCLSEPMVQAAANIAWALCAAGKPALLSYAVPECNTLGLGMLDGRTLDEAITVMEDGLADTVVILENDLYRRVDERQVDGLLGKAKHVIVIDHLMNPVCSHANIVLPAATFAESPGTLVNQEGRAQRFSQVFVPGRDIQAGWKWVDAIMRSAGTAAGERPRSLDDITGALAREIPVFAQLRDLAPPADFTIDGQRVPRQPHRYSGRTAMLADITVHEPQPPQDSDSPLSYSMEGAEKQPPPPLIPRYWTPGWNSVQALNKFQQEVGGPLRGDEPGKRLLQPDAGVQPAYFSPDPDPAHHAAADAAPPEHRIFGSEELSMHAPAIQARARQTSGDPG